MENIIHLLPDSVANQIAAGEVIQRPASVVKELVENAIDAGATQIDIFLKEAGRNLIRVIDNGKGMSPEDAKLAFERHATSKIRQATDLFHLHTMGFRGEALASIASVAQVELVTRRSDDELAWKVEIEGSVISNEEPTLAAQGSRFTVRNLFYNIPARRKFLGDNTKELKAIRDEFIQLALVNPNLQFSLTHNDENLYTLLPSNLKQRVIQIFGKRNAGQLPKQLYPVDVNTQLIRITGFVGDPAAACLRDQMQYFFVNNRFIKHKGFRSAVLKAYELLIPHGQQPTFFLYLEVDPETLDVNIHPTKTEVKFEHEQAIWPILHATVREALGKSNAIPSIDFDRDDAPEIRVFTGDREVSSPSVRFDPSYNPFKGQSTSSAKTPQNWDLLFQGFEKQKDELSSQDNIWESPLKTTDSVGEFATPSETLPANPLFTIEDVNHESTKFQLFTSYIVLQQSHSLLFIDQHRAHIRILFDRYLNMVKTGKSFSQALLFPEMLNLDAVQRIALLEVMDDLNGFGFDVQCSGNEFTIVAVPPDLKGAPPVELLEDLLQSLNEPGETQMQDRRRKLALRLAKAAAIPYGQKMSEAEMNDLVERLFSSKENKYTPDGKPILMPFTEEELSKRF
ncbi:MAG TPA: DNA mismatch repair endonuclease MutL [Bacteroidales bacterium]|nr:DNA mismatch repair endonuclease MutL [Bacteroidales bacterium]